MQNDQPQSEQTTIALMQQDITYIRQSIDDIKLNYVRKDEFRPVRMIAYGMVGAILLSVIGGIMALLLYRVSPSTPVTAAVVSGIVSPAQ